MSLYDNFNKQLYRIGSTDQPFIDPTTGQIDQSLTQSDLIIDSGDNSQIIDPGLIDNGQSINQQTIAGGFLQSANFKTGSTGWRIDANGDLEANNGNFRGDITGATGTFSGALIAGELHIPDKDTTANSFHSDTLGNIWSGATYTNRATAPFRVSNAGVIVATSITLTGLQAGSDLDGQYITVNTITADKIITTTLSAIAADLGTITAGNITLPSGGFIRSGQTAFDTGTGFYIGNNAGTPKFSIGIDTGNKLTWDGTTLAVKGAITIDSGSGIANLSDAGALAVLNTVGTAQINALAVNDTKIASNAVTVTKIATDAVTNAKIATDAVGSNEIAAGAIIAGKIAAGTIVAADIATGTITSNEIAANTIIAGNIAAGTITANEITVSQLSALSANLGTITAGSININSGKAIIDSVGKITATDITIGNRFLVVAPGESIQTAIDSISSTGGRIVIQNGTHSLSANLILYSGVYLEGESAGSAILDFQTNAYGIEVVGTNPYSTGTISVTNNSITVTGVSTVWTSGMLGQSIMLGGAWYPIVAVASNTSLTIAIPFAGVTLSAGTSYTIATLKKDVKITDLTIKNASVGIKLQYTNETFFRDTDIQSSVVGLTADDSAQGSMNELDFTANNSGAILTNCHFFGLGQLGSVDAQAGNGITFTNCTNIANDGLFVINSSGNGISITGCSNLNFSPISCIENGGQGIELVSGNKDIAILGGTYESNASDGIKLTGTTDNLQMIGNSIKNNGGYGVNINASDCDGNNITGNNFAGNTSGAVNDSGTGTIVRGNSGIDDNTSGKFGGNGSDSTLTISSGTTTIDLGGLAIVEKNYTSISITGTGELIFINPHTNGTVVVLKSQGNVTLTSSTVPNIDMSGIGAEPNTNAQGILDDDSHQGGTATGTTGGVGGLRYSNRTFYSDESYKILLTKSIFLTPGSGGSSGTSTGGTGSGTPGNGGGALLIECFGSLDFTGSISVSGGNGAGGGTETAGSGSISAGGAGGGHLGGAGGNGGDGDGTGTKGGGGGGASGMCVIIANTILNQSGTITSAGGNGGDGTTSTTYTTGGGGGGASAIASGSNGTSGNPGIGGGGGASAGGLIILNTVFY